MDKNQNNSFVTFGSETETNDIKCLSPVGKDGVDFFTSETLSNTNYKKNSNLFETQETEQIADYIAETNENLSELIKIKDYLNPILVFNSHTEKFQTVLEQKQGTNDFQVENANFLYTLNENVKNWIKSYNSYNNLKFHKFDDKFRYNYSLFFFKKNNLLRPVDPNYATGRLLFQIAKKRQGSISIDVFENGEIRLQNLKEYSKMRMYLQALFSYYDQFDDDIEEFYIINLKK